MILDDPVVWGTFYDIRRYGGMQIFLCAMLGRRSLVLSSTEETTADHLHRALPFRHRAAWNR